MDGIVWFKRIDPESDGEVRIGWDVDSVVFELALLTDFVGFLSELADFSMGCLVLEVSEEGSGDLVPG